MSRIQLDRLHKSFQRHVAVRDLDLTIENGELLVLLGPSGCGKTTTLNCIAGLEMPSSGRVLFDGEDVTTTRRTSATSPWCSSRRCSTPTCRRGRTSG